MFSSIFISRFIALGQSEASILGGIRNMVIISCQYTTYVRARVLVVSERFIG